MTTIAHITDLHLLEASSSRPLGERVRRACLSFGRWVSAALRRQRAALALRAAYESGADHVVVTGDLTEEGTTAQFETLAELLYESGLDPRRVTLVPGNHDAYSSVYAFRHALGGPLAAFAAASPEGAVTVLDEVAIMAVSSAMAQPVTRSAGVIDRGALDRMSRWASPERVGRRALVVAQHHPPYRHPRPGMQWLDGLLNHRHQRALLECYPQAHVLHGHLHQACDVALMPLGDKQVFGARDVVGSDGPVVRLFTACDGGVFPLEPVPPSDRAARRREVRDTLNGAC